jgi:hypothetical protein
MHTLNRKRLVLHGGAVIMLGMLSGIPMSMTLLEYITGNAADWRIAHMEGLINGLLMLAIAGCGGLLTLSKKQDTWLFFSIVFTGYSNALYGWVRGLSGQAGLDFAPPFSNQLAAILGGLPIFTAFAAVILLMIGAYKASTQD